MKIFMSHSSNYKPLIREIKKNLPEDIKTWIDEKDLIVGEEITFSLKKAIETESDYVILFIDQRAAKSEWVRKEMEWALTYGREIGRTFLLPIIVEQEAFEQFDTLRNIKCLKCLDFTENGIRSLTEALTSHLFSLIIRELQSLKNLKTAPTDSSLSLLDEADRYLHKVAKEIRLIAHPFRRDRPLGLNKLMEKLQQTAEIGPLNEHKLQELLFRLQQKGLLAGVVCLGEDIYIEEEHFAWKTTVHIDAKKRIAARAISFIVSGNIIALDAGSTTLEIARQICRGIKMRRWGDLTIVTNSIAAANELLSTSSEMGLEDNNAFLNVFIVGGRIRSNTLAVITDDSLFNITQPSDFNTILEAMHGADIAFTGTNGIYNDIGFTTLTNSEMKTKKEMLRWAKRKCIVTDASKFGIKQESIFATFNENIEILTTKDDNAEVIDSFRNLLKNTATKIVIC